MTRMTQILSRLLLLLCITMPTATPAAQQRQALVIGNAAYEDESVLQNTLNDADDISGMLRGLGFDVSELRNASYRNMRRSIARFQDRVRASTGIALIYYSGHGVQDRNRNNYLLPVDAEIRQASDIRAEGVGLNPILQQLSQRPDGAVSLVVLDACRNNPFASNSKSAGKGPARTGTPPGGTLVLYAASPGQTADDNPAQRNGLFTQQLLKEMVKRGVDIEDAFEQVALAVKQASGNDQIPYKEGNLLGKHYLVGKPEPIVPVVQGQDYRFWQSAQACGSRRCIQAYLNAFPNGQYRGLAQAMLANPDPPHRSGLEPDMLRIPGGSFQMGSTEGEDAEKPVRRVSVRAFELARTEVTRGQFRAFVDATGYRTDAEKNAGDKQGCYAYRGGNEFDWKAGSSWRDPGFEQSDSHPVVCVSWNDAEAYIDWLNGETGQRYRLPSEAEWEYAARAGSSTKYSFGDDAEQLCRYVNVADRSTKDRFGGWTVANCSDGHVFTAAVGRFRANGFGLKDMHGNVWEWIGDCWNGSYSGAPSNGKAWTRGDCGRRVLRGGSWLNGPSGLRSASRNWDTRGARGNYLGFRLARAF